MNKKDKILAIISFSLSLTIFFVLLILGVELMTLINIVLGLFSLFFIYFFLSQIKIQININRVHKELKNCNLDGALTLYEKLLKNKNGKTFNALISLNKAMVLYYKGNFDESLTLMRSIEEYIESKVKGMNKYLYYNNLLTLYLDSGKLGEAKQLYQNKNKLFIQIKVSKNSKLKKSFEHTLARYDIDFGDAKKSKNELLTFLPTYKDKLLQVLTEYYISLADIKLGNANDAKIRMQRICENTKGLFIYDRITEFLKK